MSLLWLPFLPLAGALLVVMAGRLPNLREALSLLTAAVLAALTFSWYPVVTAGETPTVVLFDFLGSAQLAFSLEPLGLLFASVASGLWFVTTLYAAGYMRGNNEAHQTRFFTCFAIAICGAMGVALADNLLTLFLFYELLTLSTYPLVTHKGNAAARRGGRIYLGILLGTSIGLLLPAIVLTWVLTGTMRFEPGGILDGQVSQGMATLLYLMFAFGVGKAALMPFHKWLPAAMVAPTPVSALLHAVAVVKAGVFSILKITVYIFGLDFAAQGDITRPVMWVAAFTLIAASLIALTRDNLKERLAYSTVSQLAYITLGAALATSMSVMGGAMHILMHAFGKITLFFCAGAIYTAAHKTLVSELDGLGRAMPFTFGAFLIASLSIIGLPPLGGSWSKWYLMLGALDAEQAIMMAVFMISSLLNIAYLLPIPARAFLFKPPAGSPIGLREAPLASVVPLCLTATGCFCLFFLPGPLMALLSPWNDS